MNVHVLEMLRRAAPEWVSSEQLRQPSGVSRAAISKQMKAWQALGYEIESSPRKGYRLLRDPDSLRAEQIQPFLAGTRFAGGTYLFKEVTPSTNDDLRLLAGQGAAEGTLVLAEVQEQGRGRRGRRWFGRAGDCLQFSVLLRPPISAQEATLIPLLAATAVARALTSAGAAGVGIKWPNDVLIDGRKVCGVLCEMSVDMEGIQYAMLGIGLNVNTPGALFPPELRETACSLASVSGHPWHRGKLLVGILRELDQQIGLAWRGQFQEILGAWRASAVTLGKSIEVLMPDGRVLKGVAEDVNAQGALMLRDADGRLQALHSGEVSLNAAGAGG